VSPRRELDLRGVPCPLSWARARVQLELLPRGTEVDVLLDDPQGARDLPRAAEAAGHHVADVVRDATGWRITIEA
jgi:TusA-related sulfurtransferase